MKPIEIACRRCDQQAGEKCLWNLGFHSERIEDAVAMSSGPQTEKEQNLVDTAIEKVMDEEL